MKYYINYNINFDQEGGISSFINIFHLTNPFGLLLFLVEIYEMTEFYESTYSALNTGNSFEILGENINKKDEKHIQNVILNKIFDKYEQIKDKESFNFNIRKENEKIEIFIKSGSNYILISDEQIISLIGHFFSNIDNDFVQFFNLLSEINSNEDNMFNEVKNKEAIYLNPFNLTANINNFEDLKFQIDGRNVKKGPIFMGYFKTVLTKIETVKGKRKFVTEEVFDNVYLDSKGWFVANTVKGLINSNPKKESKDKVNTIHDCFQVTLHNDSFLFVSITEAASNDYRLVTKCFTSKPTPTSDE